MQPRQNSPKAKRPWRLRLRTPLGMMSIPPLLLVFCCLVVGGYGLSDTLLRQAHILPTLTPRPTATYRPANTPRPSATPRPTATTVVTTTPPSTNTPAAPIGPRVVIVRVNKQAEYVDIKNTGDQPQDLNGWSLLSEKGSQNCPLSGILEPGQTLRIWAQTGTGFSCGFSANIWNNNEPDPAVLYNAAGVEVSRK